MLRRLVGTTAPGHHDVQFRNEKPIKAHQTVSFSGCNGVSTYTCGLDSLPNAAVFFVDVAIQPEVRFIAKQNSLMKMGTTAIVWAHSTNLRLA
ncbi:hypothetical protein TNCV_367811 [Trichonephila clavipes]|nr:hypothetical protein TNCV_367811 [Trichonephila clavipes]